HGKWDRGEEPIQPARSMRVDVHYYADLFTKAGHRYVPMTLERGARSLSSLVELACLQVGLERRSAAVIVDGHPVRDDADAWRELVDRERIEIRLAPMPGEPVDAVLIIIAVLSAVASALLISNVSAPALTGSDDPEGRRFGFSRFSNDAIA